VNKYLPNATTQIVHATIVFTC